MKFRIHKKSKKVILLILSLLLVLACLQLFFAVLMPKTAKTEVIQYESTCKPAASYKVFILPNEVYPSTTLGEESVYSKKLLNYIQADFGMQYVGSQKVPLDIEYQIIATVNGYQGKDKEKVIYWSKDFPLSTKKTTKSEGIWNKTEKVNFAINGYDAFAVRAQEITGLDVSNDLIVSMKGKVIAHTEKEDLETPFDVNLEMPLMEDAFQIEKNNLDPISSNVKTMKEMPITLNLVKVIPYGILLLISVVGLIITIFFTRELNYEEMMTKRVNNIIKNYGSRIIALQNIPKTEYRQNYKVHSMKDLIKIADEIQKPIFYETDKDSIVKNLEFRVIENDTIYSLVLDSTET